MALLAYDDPFIDAHGDRIWAVSWPDTKEWDEAQHPRAEDGKWTEAEGARTLYHGTGKGHLRFILERGLQHTRDGHVYGGVGKRDPHYVFLAKTEDDAKMWAVQHGLREAPETGRAATPVVLEVHIPAAHVGKLTIDERGSEYSGKAAYRFAGDIRPEWIKHVMVGPHQSPNADEAAEGPWRQIKADGDRVIYVGLVLVEDEPDTKAWDESQHPRAPAGSASGGEFTSGGGSAYFDRIDTAPTTEGIVAAEENWAGGLANFGDPEAAIVVQSMPGYSEYRSHLEEAARATLGETFTVYRLMSADQVDEWKNGADIGPVAVTLEPKVAASFVNFAGFQGDKQALQVFAFPTHPGAIIMRGKVEESELVVDANATSGDELRPMPMATKAVAKAPTPEALAVLAERLAPTLRRAFLEAIDATHSAVDLEALAQALQTGDVTLAEATFRLDLLARSLEAAWVPTLRQGFLLGAQAAVGAMKPHLSIGFSLISGTATRWAQTYGAQLVTQITEDTRATLKDIITRGFTDGIDVRDLAKEIRPLIGLTAPHARAVENYRARLLADGEEIGSKVDRYAAKLLRYRANLIARNEVLVASGEGQAAQWKAAIAEGLLDGGTVLKRWIVADDERLCELCAPLEGIEVGINDVFPGGYSKPPDPHPACRCSVGLIFPSVEKQWVVKWDESQHPRAPEGAPESTGGQFTTGGGEPGGAMAAEAGRARRERLAAFMAREDVPAPEATPVEPPDADVIFAEARRQFGTTEDPWLAGYLLPDGDWLDFSGGGGQRFEDHRQIGGLDAYDSIENDTDAMIHFMQQGAVRWMPLSDAANANVSLDAEPTGRQYREMVRAARERELPLRFEVDDHAGRTVASEEFDRPTVEVVREVFAQARRDQWTREHSGKKGWTVKWDENQPREPAGSPTGGQWTAGGATAAGNPLLPEVNWHDPIALQPRSPHARPTEFRMEGGRLQYREANGEWRDNPDQPGDWKIDPASGNEIVMGEDGQFHPQPLKYDVGEVFVRDRWFGEWQSNDEQLGALRMQGGTIYALKLGEHDVPQWVVSEDQPGTIRTGEGGHQEQLVGMGEGRSPVWEQQTFTPTPSSSSTLSESFGSSSRDSSEEDLPPDPARHPSAGTEDDDAAQKALLREGAVSITYLGGGVSKSYKATMTDGTKAVWKPKQDTGFRRARNGEHINDAAAYDLAKAVGYDDLVAPTIVRTINGQEGSLQRWMGGDSPLGGSYSRRDRERAAAFDYVIGNYDRHEHNWFDLHSKPVLIDSGRSFPKPENRPNLYTTFGVGGHKVSREAFVEWKKVLDDRPHVERILRRNGMDAETVGAAFKRIDRIVAANAAGETWDRVVFG